MMPDMAEQDPMTMMFDQVGNMIVAFLNGDIFVQKMVDEQATKIEEFRSQICFMNPFQAFENCGIMFSEAAKEWIYYDVGFQLSWENMMQETGASGLMEMSRNFYFNNWDMYWCGDSHCYDLAHYFDYNEHLEVQDKLYFIADGIESGDIGFWLDDQYVFDNSDLPFSMDDLYHGYDRMDEHEYNAMWAAMDMARESLQTTQFSSDMIRNMAQSLAEFYDNYEPLDREMVNQMVYDQCNGMFDQKQAELQAMKHEAEMAISGARTEAQMVATQVNSVINAPREQAEALYMQMEEDCNAMSFRWECEYSMMNMEDPTMIDPECYTMF